MKMPMSIFTRFGNIRNVMHINNLSANRYTLNNLHHSNIISKRYCTAVNSENVIETCVSDEPSNKKISKAMKIYLQRSLEYKSFIEKQIAEYDIGKRYLANMMGKDPDQFTQADINEAISYLFPSGLYDKRARPIMEHPTKLYKDRKEAAFDDAGRPHHFLYYTTKPNYYEQLHKIASSIIYLNKIEDKKILLNYLPTVHDKVNIEGTVWLTKDEIEKKILEHITNSEYDYFITSMERLITHPVSKHASAFVMEFRKAIDLTDDITEVPEVQYDSDNRPFVLVENCKRKTSIVQVKVIGNGSGNITINGKDITYFDDIQCREQENVCECLQKSRQGKKKKIRYIPSLSDTAQRSAKM